MRLLEKIINTDEECSDEQKHSETENKMGKDGDLFDTSPFLGILTRDNKQENILNKCRGQTKRLVLKTAADTKLAIIYVQE